LYRRADERVDNMLRQGFVEEVETQMNKGYSLSLPSMSSIGYREIGKYLEGGMTLEGAVYKIKTGTHRFIRHQYAWFRLKDERIKWFDIEKAPEPEIIRTLAEFFEQ
jgi:tRNA dimethylallyltransferase